MRILSSIHLLLAIIYINNCNCSPTSTSTPQNRFKSSILAKIKSKNMAGKMSTAQQALILRAQQARSLKKPNSGSVHGFKPRALYGKIGKQAGKGKLPSKKAGLGKTGKTGQGVNSNTPQPTSRSDVKILSDKVSRLEQALSFITKAYKTSLYPAATKTQSDLKIVKSNLRTMSSIMKSSYNERTKMKLEMKRLMEETESLLENSEKLVEKTLLLAAEEEQQEDQTQNEHSNNLLDERPTSRSAGFEASRLGEEHQNQVPIPDNYIQINGNGKVPMTIGGQPVVMASSYQRARKTTPGLPASNLKVRDRKTINTTGARGQGWRKELRVVGGENGRDNVNRVNSDAIDFVDYGIMDYGAAFDVIN